MLPNDDFWARLAVEADELRREEPGFEPIDNDITHWRGFIMGTGLYEGGVYIFDIEIPRDYPFKPPKAIARTKIFHPNLFNERICVGILGKDWAPANNLVDVVESLRFLLSNPNPDDPLHSSAARMMKEDFEEFKNRVIEWRDKYATWDQPLLP